MTEKHSEKSAMTKSMRLTKLTIIETLKKIGINGIQIIQDGQEIGCFMKKEYKRQNQYSINVFLQRDRHAVAFRPRFGKKRSRCLHAQIVVDVLRHRHNEKQCVAPCTALHCYGVPQTCLLYTSHVSRGTLDTGCQSSLSNTGLSPSMAGLPMPFFSIPLIVMQVLTPENKSLSLIHI